MPVQSHPLSTRLSPTRIFAVQGPVSFEDPKTTQPSHPFPHVFQTLHPNTFLISVTLRPVSWPYFHNIC